MARTPSPEDREGLRRRPSGRPSMHQNWRDLLFLHWEAPVEAVQAALPEGLAADTFELRGEAALAAAGFAEEASRPPVHAHFSPGVEVEVFPLRPALPET